MFVWQTGCDLDEQARADVENKPAEGGGGEGELRPGSGTDVTGEEGVIL